MKTEVDITVIVDGMDADPQVARTVTFGVGEIITSYNDLDDMPKIEDKKLQGNMTAAQLGLATINDISWGEF